jgi:hypothetical protein
MAFDLVYDEGRFLVLEMSYAFNDEAIYKAPGHFIVDNGSVRLRRVEGHVWPQALQIDYVRRLLAESPMTKE